MVNNIPLNGWPQLKDLEAVQPTLDRLDKIEAWKRTVKEETFTGDDITIENALALPARSLITEINAIQDLHGYDHPWAGGADVNKFDISSATMAGYISVFGLTVAKDSDGYITITGTYTDESGVPKFAIIPTLPLLDNAVFYLMDKNAAANTNVIQCRWSNPSTGGVAIDLQNMVQNQTYNIKFRLMIVTDGTVPTSYRPYSNICPISGRTEESVDTVGRNVWDEQWELGTYNVTTGEKSSSNERIRSKNYIPVKANTTYYVYAGGYNIGSYGLTKFAYDAEYNYLGKIGSDYVTSFTTPDGCAYITFSPNTYYGTTYNNDICINVSDPTFNGQYVPYAGCHTATIQLGTTVYGADINWDTGVMTVDRASDDLGDYTFTYDSGTNSMKCTMSGCKRPSADTVAFNAILSICPVIAAADRTTTSGIRAYMFAFGDIELYIRDSGYTDATQFKTAMTGQTICYELATPTTIQLTPTMLEMLKGYNLITLTDGYGTIELKALTGANWS